MATAARDRLARMLRGDVKSAFSVEVTARPDNLRLEVDGFGPVKFPVTPAKARKLIGLGLPARFGRGEETVTDPAVRDTWEIPKHLVHATWNEPALQVILETIKEELGIPNGGVLTADLHSLLVYEPNQFFLAHQDSEKDDAMVGTLVVTLPSNYTGGDLMVGHNEEWKAYGGSKTVLSLVAFYTDCQHEVLRVQSGYRITLTYNLLLHGDTSRPDGEEGKLAELAALLREHFATPAPRYLYGDPAEVPNRLVYLLDHEYTPRALNWTRLKGADAARASLLRTAAERAGYEAILALADLKTSHSALPEDELYGYRRRWNDDDDYGTSDGDEGDRKYEIQELIDSEVTLTHWTGPDGRRLEQTSLSVNHGEMCASTENGDLTPYSVEYEGYMGNWGNTLDRWYHRAAIVVWPRSQAFANRAETSPGWALDEITAMAAVGDVAGARDAAGSLAPFWDRAVRGLIPAAAGDGAAASLMGRALSTAAAVADALTASALLKPFRVESLEDAHARPLATVASDYGEQWTADLLQIWFGDGKRAWEYGAGAARPRWVADRLPGLCQTLRATGGGGADATARLLLDLSWAWLASEIDSALALPGPRSRDRHLDDLGKPLAAVLTSVSALGAAPFGDIVSGHIGKQAEAVTPLELSALRASATSEDAGFADLAADCAARLRRRLALPQRTAGDWSIALPAGDCTCELCATLETFLADAQRLTFKWPLAKHRRQHIHGRIDKAELPVTHVTRRQGSPYTLVLSKTDALFTGEDNARKAAQTDLEWLTDRWNIPG